MQNKTTFGQLQLKIAAALEALKQTGKSQYISIKTTSNI